MNEQAGDEAFSEQRTALLPGLKAICFFFFCQTPPKLFLKLVTLSPFLHVETFGDLMCKSVYLPRTVEKLFNSSSPVSFNAMNT